MINKSIIYLFITIFMLSGTIVSAQQKIYEDLNGNKISEEAYKLIKRETDYLWAYRNEGNALVYFFVKERADSGLLSDDDFTKIKAKYPFGKNRTPIIIEYFPGLDECSAHLPERLNEMIDSHKTSDTKLRKKGGELYNVYKNNKGVEKISDALNWQKDDEELIEKTFFKYHYPCGSYVVINGVGEYRAFFGEYSTQQIVEDFDKLKRKK